MIKLKKASLQDYALLINWANKEYVKKAGFDAAEWRWDIELSRDYFWREQLIIEADERAIGFVQIIDPYYEESHYWGDCEPNLRAIDMFIGEEEYLGIGFGTWALRKIIKRCFKNPSVTAVLVDPLDTNHLSHNFYEKNGFIFKERRMFDHEVCRIYRFDRRQKESLPEKA